MSVQLPGPLSLFRLALCDWAPKRVVSIIGSSRSGTSIFKHALCLHPDLCSLAGEEEPYYKAAGNGYPWHESDDFNKLNHPDIVRLMISNELFNIDQVHNRKMLQLGGFEIEPFVDGPIKCRQTDTLVLKTPQVAHRKGILEQLYPEAEIIYVLMRRDPRAVVNGLLDGWESGKFRARMTPQGWWCFNMPRTWDRVGWNMTLTHRCCWQYHTAMAAARNTLDGPKNPTIRQVDFEEFEKDWQTLIREVWWRLGLSTDVPLPDELPELMTTDKPQKERWRTKRPWLDGMVTKAVFGYA